MNQEAKQAALLHGSDLRTVRSATGAPSRLLTYRVDHPDGPIYLQVGRGLADPGAHPQPVVTRADSAEVIKRSQPLTHRLQLACQPVRLPELLREIAQQATKMTGSKSFLIQIGEVEGTVWADPGRLRQVLLILLDNAIRYTPDGGTIRLEALPQLRTCQIMVSDTGPGIALEHLPHIFDRFYQANPIGESYTRSNGLGLSIAQGIIVSLGGKIHIHSRPGEGTRAIVELPVPPS